MLLAVAVSVPLAVGAHCLPPEAEAGVEVQMLRDHHGFLSVAQKESLQVPAGAIARGSCPDQMGFLLGHESLALDVRCAAP